AISTAPSACRRGTVRASGRPPWWRDASTATWPRTWPSRTRPTRSRSSSRPRPARCSGRLALRVAVVAGRAVVAVACDHDGDEVGVRVVVRVAVDAREHREVHRVLVALRAVEALVLAALDGELRVRNRRALPLGGVVAALAGGREARRGVVR